MTKVSDKRELINQKINFKKVHSQTIWYLSPHRPPKPLIRVQGHQIKVWTKMKSKIKQGNNIYYSKKDTTFSKTIWLLQTKSRMARRLMKSRHMQRYSSGRLSIPW